MNDRGVSSLGKAQKSGQFRKDRENKKQGARYKNARRNSGSGLSSSSSGLSGGTSTLSSRNSFKNNITSNSSSAGIKDAEAKKRIKREQQIDRTIKALEEFPVLNKYAKAAKMAKKAEKVMPKKPSLMGFLGGAFKKMNKNEQDAALAADSRGEEYDESDAEAQYTISLDKKTKRIAFAIIAGILLSNIFLCIIMVSAVTGGAKESYLASKDNPTEEELAEAYSKDEDVGDTNSSSSSSSSSFATGSIKSGSTSNIIMVGDSRTVGQCGAVYNGTNCSSYGYKVGNTTFIAKVSQKYDWFHNTALSEIKKQLNSNKKSTVFINMGTNGFENVEGYASDYSQLAKDYKDANIIAVSVTPIIDSKVTSYKDTIKDANVVKFNNNLKSKISSDVIYCDVYSQVKGKVDASDGVHYDNASYKLIDDAMKNCLTGGSSSGDSSFNSLLSKGGTTVDNLNSKNIKQLVVVDSSATSDSTTAKVYFYENSSGGWKKVSSLDADGYVGRRGTTDSPKEGYAGTPKGLYGVGDAFYQSSKPNTKLNSFKITSNTYWVDDSNSKYYNKRVEGTSNKDWNSAEHMSEIPSYKYGFVIEYNTNPIKKGAGSAIFFHVSHSSPTAGCVSVSEDKVIAYLKKLDKSKNPYILIV